MVRYAGKCKKVYQLEDKPFKSGGEGGVYNIIGEPDFVAKIYKNRPSRELEEKILAMVETVPKLDKNFLNICAWPIDALYDTDNKFTGFVMPKINGMQQLKDVYPYGERKLTWDKYLIIARNLAAAVNNVHEIGQVIGDLNPRNVLVNVNTGMLTLIDADSFHVKNVDGDIYRCIVGQPEYVAPELQGKTFSEIPAEQSFSKDSDNFALSVLIFRILINGAHPFACKTEGKSSSKFQPIDNISSGTCVYFTNSSDISIPPYAPDLSCLPKDMQELFKRAFVDGYKNPSARPSADEWYFVLDRLSNQLKTCSINAEHLYYQGASECPWCSVDRKMGSIISRSTYVPSTQPTISQQPVSSPKLPKPTKPIKLKMSRKTRNVIIASTVVVILLVIIIAAAVSLIPGSIYVTSSPSGATVYLDGIKQDGTTPLTINDVTSGEHTLRYSLSGYDDVTRIIKVSSGQKSSASTPTLTKIITGSVYVSSTPSGASIYIDDYYKGTTPLTIDSVRVGSHTLKVSLSGYDTQSKSITVSDGRKTSEYFTLRKAGTGSIYVTSTPTGASVYLDGAYKGTTPLTINDLSPDRYRIAVMKYGYHGDNEQITVTKGSTTSSSLTLEKIDTSKYINWDIEMVKLVDGDKYHTITYRIANYGYEKRTFTVTVFTYPEGDKSKKYDETTFTVTVNGNSAVNNDVYLYCPSGGWVSYSCTSEVVSWAQKK